MEKHEMFLREEKHLNCIYKYYESLWAFSFSKKATLEIIRLNNFCFLSTNIIKIIYMPYTVPGASRQNSEQEQYKVSPLVELTF